MQHELESTSVCFKKEKCKKKNYSSYLRYNVVAVSVDGGQHQSCQERQQTEGEAAKADWERLPGATERNHLHGLGMRNHLLL